MAVTFSWCHIIVEEWKGLNDEKMTDLPESTFSSMNLPILSK